LKQQHSELSYSEYCIRQPVLEVSQQIDRDMDRVAETLTPLYELIVHEGSRRVADFDIFHEETRQISARILRAMCVRNPQLGYAQEMGNASSVIVTILTNEEHAFWVLCTSFEDLLPRDMCAPGPPAFRGVRIMGKVLQDLGEERLACIPTGLPPEWWTQVANKFVPTLFAGVLGGVTLIRILDSFFCGGGLRTLIGATLTLCEIYIGQRLTEEEQLILKTDGNMFNADAPTLLWGIFPFTKAFDDADALLAGVYGEIQELSAEDLDRRVHQERSRLVRIWQCPPSEPQETIMYAGWHMAALSAEEIKRLHYEYLAIPPATEEGLDRRQWVEIISGIVGPSSRWAWCDADRLFTICDVDGVGAVAFPQAVQCIVTLLVGDLQVLLELVFKCYEQRRALQLRSGTGALEADDIDNFAQSLVQAAHVEADGIPPLESHIFEEASDHGIMLSRLCQQLCKDMPVATTGRNKAKDGCGVVTREQFITGLIEDEVVLALLRVPRTQDCPKVSFYSPTSTVPWIASELSKVREREKLDAVKGGPPGVSPVYKISQRSCVEVCKQQ